VALSDVIPKNLSRLSSPSNDDGSTGELGMMNGSISGSWQDYWIRGHVYAYNADVGVDIC